MSAFTSDAFTADAFTVDAVAGVVDGSLGYVAPEMRLQYRAPIPGSSMQRNYCRQIRQKPVSGTMTVEIDFTDSLQTGTTELLDSWVVTEVGTTDLTIVDDDINTGEISIMGVSVDTGMAGTVSIAGGSAGVRYTCKGVVTTSEGQTWPINFYIDVISDS